MTITAVPSRKSDVDPNLYAQLMKLRQQAKEHYDQGKENKPAGWMMPDKTAGGWGGDPFDWETMIKKVFNRDESNRAFKLAVKTPVSPGTTGDLAITTTQIDYLAGMGRAFAMRHTMRWPRAMAHALARRRAQGDQKLGLFQNGILEYIRGLVRQSSGEEAT